MNLDVLKQRAKAFDYLFDSVVVTDLQGTIIDWNKGSRNLYGYSKAEAVGQPVHILHVPEDIDRITAEVLAAIQASGKWSGEIRMLHKSGRTGWIESMCVPIYDENDQMVGALGVNRDITARINETKRLEHLAHYDQLTQLPNRYLFFDRAEQLIRQSKRYKRKFALLFVDLDKFKQINDTRGHAFGDQVLVEVALRLKQLVRDADTVARIGGDEFVLLLENISNRDDAMTMVANLINGFKEKFIIHGQALEIDCSIGVAIYPDECTTIDALLGSADTAMYNVKRAQ